MPLKFTPDEEPSQGKLKFTAEEPSAPEPSAPDNSPLEERLARARKKVESKGKPDVNPYRTHEPIVKDWTSLGEILSGYGGEVAGGVSDTAHALGGLVGTPNKPGESTFQRILSGALGPLRAAAPVLSFGTSPMISDASQVLAEKGAQLAGDAGMPNLAGVLGAAGEIVPGLLAGKLAGPLRNKIVEKFPNRAERTKEMTRAVGRDVDIANREAEAATQRARDVQTKVVGERDAAISAAQKDAAKQEAAVPKAEQLKVTPETTESTGKRMAQSYETDSAASRATFTDQYEGLREKAAAVKGPAEEYSKVLKKIHGDEAGISQPLPTQAEKAAGKARSIIDRMDDAENEVAGLSDQAKNAADPLHRLQAEAKLQSTTQSRLPAKPTVEDMINERQRLSAGQRMAERAKDDNLARQFRELKDGLTQDINNIAPDIGKSLATINDAYRTTHAPFYGAQSEIRKAFQRGPESVVETLVPTAKDPNRVAKLDRLQSYLGTPERQKPLADAFVKSMVDKSTEIDGALNWKQLGSKWMDYADPGTNDKVLKSMLGDRYQGMKELVVAGGKTSADDIQATLKKTVENIERGAKPQVDTLKGMLGEADTVIDGMKVPGKTGSIETARAAKVAALEKEMQEKLKAMGVKVTKGEGGQYVGMAGMLHGAIGLLMGSSAAIPQIVTGGVIFAGAPLIMKLMGSAKGLELINKQMRAAPGTAAAAVIARQIKAMAESEEKKKNGTNDIGNTRRKD